MAARHRSPAYPATTLTQALSYLSDLREKEGRNFVPVHSAVSAWGYSPKSSGGKQVVAALKAYGLLEDKGSGDNRSVRISDAGFNIDIDKRPNSSERARLLEIAALTPKIISELFAEFPDGNVSESTLKFVLHKKNFNPNAIDDIVDVFFDAMSYIGSTEEQPEQEEFGNQTESQEIIYPKAPEQRSQKVSQATYPLVEGNASLSWPQNISSKSAVKMKRWLELMINDVEDLIADLKVSELGANDQQKNEQA